MNQRLVIVLLILFGFTYKQAYCQLFFTKGYVVLTSGDTLTGEVRERNSQLIELRSIPENRIQAYTPNEIIGYQPASDTKRLAVKFMEDGQEIAYFMQEQIKGYVSLYRLFKPEGRLTHAIRLPNQTFVPLRGNLTLLMLKQHLTDCTNPAFTRLLTPQTFDFTSNQIERVVNTYNNCVRPGQTVKKQKKKLTYEAGLLLGIAQNGWTYTDAAEVRNLVLYWDPNGAYKPVYTATGGGFITLAPHKKLSATIEVVYTQYKGERTIFINTPLDPSDKRSRLYSFSESYFAIPLTGRYTFLNKSVRCYVKAGAVPTYATALKGSYVGDDPNLVPGRVDIKLRPGFGIGYLIGLGAEFKLTEKRHLSVEVRTMPHLVLDRSITHIANARSLQLVVNLPLVQR